MNSPTTPRVAPDSETQRLMRPMQSSAKGFPINATGFNMSEAEAVERATAGGWCGFRDSYMGCINGGSIPCAFGWLVMRPERKI